MKNTNGEIFATFRPTDVKRRLTNKWKASAVAGQRQAHKTFRSHTKVEPFIDRHIKLKRL